MDACYNADGLQKCATPAKVTSINNPQKKVTNVKSANMTSLVGIPNKLQVLTSTNKGQSFLLENKFDFKKVYN